MQFPLLAVAMFVLSSFGSVVFFVVLFLYVDGPYYVGMTEQRGTACKYQDKCLKPGCAFTHVIGPRAVASWWTWWAWLVWVLSGSPRQEPCEGFYSANRNGGPRNGGPRNGGPRNGGPRNGGNPGQATR